MTAQTTPTPEADARPTWQRYLPAGAAATVAVAAIIGVQAASSDGSATQRGPQSAPPAAQGNAPTQDGAGQNGQQVPPWGQNDGPAAQDGQLPPGAGRGQQLPPGLAVPQSPDSAQGLASPRTSVS